MQKISLLIIISTVVLLLLLVVVVVDLLESSIIVTHVAVQDTHRCTQAPYGILTSTSNKLHGETLVETWESSCHLGALDPIHNKDSPKLLHD